MVFCSPMLAVADMERSVAFYRRVLGLEVVLDFGANKTLTGGLALQTAQRMDVPLSYVTACMAQPAGAEGGEQ